MISFISLLFIVSSFACSIGKKDSNKNPKSSLQNPGEPATPPTGSKYPEATEGGETQAGSINSLVLTKLSPAGLDKKRLKMSLTSKLAVGINGDVTHVSPTGLSSQFDAVGEKWGAGIEGDPVENTIFYANLISDGWVLSKENEISYLDPEAASLESFSVPLKFSKPEFTTGISKGFMSFFFEGSAFLFKYGKDLTELIKFNAIKIAFKGIGRCKIGCVVWGWDGEKFYYLPSLSDQFIAMDMSVTFPEASTLLTVGGILTIKEDKSTFEHFFSLDKEFNLYRGGQKTQDSLAPIWENVLRISNESCLPCHKDDGFEKKTVWTGFKEDILKRIDPKNKTESFAMPTNETKFSEEMTDASRLLMATWLEGEKATKAGEFANVLVKDTTPLTGVFKRLSDTYCKSCHPEATTQEYWLERRADAIKMVNSGEMPKGKKMSDTTQKNFIKFIKQF